MVVYLNDLRRSIGSAASSIEKSRLSTQQNSLNSQWAEDELERERALAAGGKENPDGTITPKDKGFMDHVGGFFDRVGEVAGNAASGAVDFTVETAKGIKNTADIAFEDDPAKKRELFAEQRRQSAAFDDAGHRLYDAAQYIPGFSIGTEGVGALAALATGEDGEVNKRLIKLLTNKDWDDMSEEEKGSAITERNIGGALSSLDVLGPFGKAAGMGIKTGAKETFRGGLKTAAKNAPGAVKESGRAAKDAFTNSYANKGIKEILDQGAGNIAKQSAKSTAVGTAVGAGLGVGINAAMGGEDWADAAVQGAASGAIGGFLGSPLDSVSTRGTKTDTAADTTVKKADDGVQMTDEQIAKKERQSADFDKRLASIKQEMTALQDGTDPTVKRVVANDGTDVTAVAEKYDKDVQDLETQIRDLQEQAEGSTAPEAATQTDSTTKPTLNVGLKVGDEVKLTPEDVTKVLKEKFGVNVKSSSVKESNSEPTFIPELDRALTKEEVHELSVELGQEAIPHHTGKEGILAGPEAASWGGEFLPEEFMNQEGKSYKAVGDISEYTGDAEGRAKAAEKIPQLRQQIEDLRAKQSEQFEMLGGVSETTDTGAVSSKFKELKRERNAALKWKLRNNLGETQESLQKKIDDLDDGAVSEDLVEIREDVDTALEAVDRVREFDADDTTGIQRAAIINEVHRTAANNKLAKLWTQEKADDFVVKYDADYKLKAEEIKEMPEPKRVAEMETLNATYVEVMENNRLRVETDMDEVVAAQQALDITDDIDQHIVDHFNDLQGSDPVAFGSVDESEVAAVRSGLDAARILKKAQKTPNDVTPLETETAVNTSIEDSPDVETTTAIINDDPGLAEQAGQMVTAEVQNGKLKGNYTESLFVTTRDNLSKLDGGDKMLEAFDEGLHGQAVSNGELKVRSREFDWKSTFDSSEVSEQSIAFWDKGEPLVKLKNETNGAFETRVRAADDIKKWFSEWADKRGLTQEQRVSNYFAHIFDDPAMKDVESTAEALARLNSGINANGNKLTDTQRDKLLKKIEGVPLATQQMIASKKIYKVGKDGHAIKREGADGWSRDIPFVLEMYNKSSVNAVYMQPAFEKIQKMTSDLGDTQRAFVDGAIDAVAGRMTLADKKLPKHLRKALSTTRRTSNMALMGLSVRTAAIQPTAIINNWRLSKDMGGNTSQFIVSNLRAFVANNQGIKNSPLLREYLSNGGMQDSFSHSLKSGKGSKLESTMFSGITYMDRGMRLAAYDQGKQAWLRDNAVNRKSPTPKEVEQAKAHGMKAAREAQFGIGPLDIPLSHNSEFGKMIFQLQQFNLKQSGKELGMLFGKKGVFRKNGWIDEKTGNLNPIGATNVAKTIAGYYAMWYMFTQLDPSGEDGDGMGGENILGLGFEDLIPFGEQVSGMVDMMQGKEADIQAPVPIAYSLMFGRPGSYSDHGVIGGSYEAITGKTFGGAEVDKEQALANTVRGALRSFVPAGTQINRTVTGVEGLSQGESKNQSGSTRFLVDQNNGWNVIKGLVGGQYATDEGQEWLRNGMNTISKKQTIELPDGNKVPVSEYVRDNISDPEQQAAWIGYYSTKQNADKQLKDNDLSRDDFLRTLRLKRTAGTMTPEQAGREAEKYNEKVRELYRPYYETIKEFPPRLANDYLEDVLINPNGIKPISKQSMNEEKYNTLNDWYEYESR